MAPLDGVLTNYHSGTEMPQRGPSTPSFDHLIRAGEQSLRHSKAERLCGVEIHHQFIFRRLLADYGLTISAAGALRTLTRSPRRHAAAAMAARSDRAPWRNPGLKLTRRKPRPDCAERGSAALARHLSAATRVQRGIC